MVLTFLTFSGLYLAAVLGWVRTHHDLQARPFFRARPGLRRLLALAVPATAAAGLEVLAGSWARQLPAGVETACALLGAAGIVLLVGRPFHPARCHARPPEADRCR